MSYENVDERDTGQGGMRAPSVKLIALLLIVVALAVFVFQNDEDAQIEFLGWDVEWPIALVIGISVVAGVILDRLAGWLWRRARRNGRGPA